MNKLWTSQGQVASVTINQHRPVEENNKVSSPGGGRAVSWRHGTVWRCDGVEYYHWSPSLTIIKQVRLRPGPVLSLWCLSLSRGILWNIKFLPRPKSQILRWKNRCSSRVFPEFDWQPGWVWNHQLEFRSTSSLDTAWSQHNTCPPPLPTSSNIWEDFFHFKVTNRTTRANHL